MEITSNKPLQPLLVLVSGAPGSGKSTFASKLANHMSLLHIERDQFFQSIAYTYHTKNIDRESIGIPRFYQAIENLLAAQVSLVVDGTLYKGKSELELRRLQEFAMVINVHCRAVGSNERFYTREVARAEGIPGWPDSHMPHLTKIRPLVEDPLELDWKIIEVETTGDYNPSIPNIADTINKLHGYV